MPDAPEPEKKPAKPTAGSPAARRRSIRHLERMLDLPMAVLSLVFFALIIADFALPPQVAYRRGLDEATLVIWLLFVAEYLVRLAMAPDKASFFRHRLLDLVFLLFPALQMLRVIRLARAGYSLFRLGIGLRRGLRGLERFLVATRFGYVAAITGVVVLTASAAMLALEREVAGSPIRSFGTALWWGAAIVTTVGSDVFPVSAGGRVLAVLMMVYGMAVFGYFVSHAINLLQAQLVRTAEHERPPHAEQATAPPPDDAPHDEGPPAR